MSGKGNCYDNACAESFFHSLKVEATHGERFATREEMRHYRHLACITHLGLALEVGETCHGEGGGNHFFGHVAAPLPQQGDQIGLG